MTTQSQRRLKSSLRWQAVTVIAVLTCFAGSCFPCHAAPPSLQPLVQPGKWPATPRGFASSVQVAGNRAYLGAGAAGLIIIDVSNPTNCVPLGKYQPGNSAGTIALSGKYAYVGDYAGTLHIVDVSNPTNCVRLGGYDTSGFAWNVAASGKHAFVADGPAGLLILDVSNPKECVRVGGHETKR
jgi:hypothetical protein